MDQETRLAWTGWSETAQGSPAQMEFWEAFHKVDWNRVLDSQLSWGSFFSLVSPPPQPTPSLPPPPPTHTHPRTHTRLRPPPTSQVGLQPASIPPDGSCWSHVVNAWTKYPMVAAWEHAKLVFPPCQIAQDADLGLRDLLFRAGYRLTVDNLGKVAEMKRVPTWTKRREGSVKTAGSWGGMDPENPTWRAIAVSAPVQVIFIYCIAPHLSRNSDPRATVTVYTATGHDDPKAKVQEDIQDFTPRSLVDMLTSVANHGANNGKGLPIVIPVMPSNLMKGHWETYLPARRATCPQCPPPINSLIHT